MIGRVLYISAFCLSLIYTMDSQPTDKAEGVGESRQIWGRVKWFYFCERQCAPSPRWAAKGRRAPSPQACRHTSPPSRTPQRHSVPQTQAVEQPLKPPVLPRRHCQRPQLVKGKTLQGARATVQIEQYLLCSAAQLASCCSPAATASRLASSMLLHVSLGASQLLKPASTTPRSYGRRHRSWHYEPQAQTNC
jgi:hypothetical protein